MPTNGVKQRQRSSSGPQNGETRREEGERSRTGWRSGTEARSRTGWSPPDVKLSLGLAGLSVSVFVFISWLLLQQSAALADVSRKYESLSERIRGVRALEAELTELSRKLQTSADAAPLLSQLSRTAASIRESTAVLQKEQEVASQRLRMLTDGVRSAAETWQSGQTAASDELHVLKMQSRAAHGRVTESINHIDRRLRELSERLEELEDGIRRNTRVLDRTEEEDAQQARDQLDWNAGRLSRLQEQLRRLSALGHEHWDKLETGGPRTHRWQETHLPAAEESVRSMLRLRAQVSGVHGRLQELTLQCAGLHAPSVSQMEALNAEVSQMKERLSSLAGQRQELQQNLSALAQAVEDTENRTVQVSNEVTSKVASVRTDLRRMAGLETEVEMLLNQTKALEEKVGQAEKLMVKRIGDLLAGSIDRVSALKSSADRDTQRLDGVARLVQQLSVDNRNLTDRFLALESGQAKLLKMATFAGDLKPKVFTIRQELAIIEPKLDDLTLRIGQLAEDMMSREEESAGPKERYAVRTDGHTPTGQTAHRTGTS